MIRRSLMIALVGASMLAASPVLAQGIGHTFFMRGSIVDISSSGTVVCVGKADGAEVGQVLDVYRNVRNPAAIPSKTGPAPFTRVKVGQVSIDHVFDDHYAHVSVKDGKPAQYDTVELRRN